MSGFVIILFLACLLLSSASAVNLDVDDSVADMITDTDIVLLSVAYIQLAARLQRTELLTLKQRTDLTKKLLTMV